MRFYLLLALTQQALGATDQALTALRGAALG